MKPTTLLWCALAVAACASTAPPTAAETKLLAEARELMANEPSAALVITERLLRDNPDLRAARLLDAEGSLRLAQRGASNRELLLQDAASNFEKALEDVPENSEPGAFALLAECRYELREYELALDAAMRAAVAFTAVNTSASNTRAAEAMLLAGRCELQLFIAARRTELETGEKDARGRVPAEKDTMHLAQKAVTCFSQAGKRFPGEAVTQIAVIHQWLGDYAAVGEELERGIRSTPQELLIHDAYIKWMTDNGRHDAMVGAYAGFVREKPDVTMLRWCQGRAMFARADRLRAEGGFEAAAAGYGKARAVFGEYLAMVPAHADAANQWIALCELSMARLAADVGDLRGAETHLFAAADASKLTTAYEGDKPQLVDGFGNHFATAAFAIHRGLADGGDEALVRTLAFNEAVIQRCPDRWGFVYNNAALAARDLGVQKDRVGDTAAAKALWERSYAHYEKATALSPDDPRIVNDCGLMLVYHLHRDLDRARKLFDRAIEIGEAQLAALPPSATARDRELLEEAVGDAWQNIAVMMRDHQGASLENYRQYCEKAIRYFPYERREAAAMLRPQAQGGAAEAMSKASAAVDKKVAESDFDGALSVLDSIAKDCRDHAPYHRLRGDLTLRLARQSRDSGRKGTELFYQDAVSALSRAVELDGEPAATRQQLAEAQYEADQMPAAAKTASALLLHLQSQGGGKPEEVLAAHTVRANAAARAYIAAKQANQANDEQLTEARTSFRFLDEKGKLDLDQRKVWSDTELWAGAPPAAVEVYLRALPQAPDDQRLLAAIVDTAAAQKQLPLAIERLQARTDAVGLWYLGRARYLLAAEQRAANNNAEALASLDEARLCFEKSMRQNAAFRDSCEQWTAMCLGKKGNIAFWMDDLKNAEKWLLEAVRLRPDRIGEDLGLAETTKLALIRVADKHFRQKDLGKAEAVYRAAAEAANSDLDLLNNAGLFARDFGNELERGGKRKEAAEMYEQSYKAYRRAQQLDPTNVRLRNDCALIAIYHLERDWDLAKQLLDSAIADGERTLRESPPEDRNEREVFDEAVGDCYENLALWHLKHSHDGAAAAAAAQQSMQHHPGERRPGARRHLQEAKRLQQGK